MGNVLRAMKKSAKQDGAPAKATVQVITVAVDQAKAAAEAALDQQISPAATPEQAAAQAIEMLEDESATATQAAQTIAPPPEQAAQTVATPPEQATQTITTPPERPAGSSPLEVVTTQVGPEIITYHSPRSQASEQIRQLRTSLLRLTNRGTVRCMITSAQPREGKSVTAGNLAYCFSEITNKKTLLIDADLRCGRIHELFGLPNEVGLGDLLIGKCSIDDACWAVGRDNLHIIPSGKIDLNMVGEMLSGGKADDVMWDLLGRYDHVIFDTPPVLGVADAGILGRWVDWAIMAVRIHQTARKAVEQATQVLENAGLNVAGLVALDEQLGKQKGYYYGYGYYS